MAIKLRSHPPFIEDGESTIEGSNPGASLAQSSVMFNIRLFPTYILLAVQQTADLVNCSGVQSAEGTQSKEAVQRMKKSFQTRIQIII